MSNRVDNFNRADSVLTLNSPSDAAGDYTLVGTWGITSNTAYSVVSSNPCAAILDSATFDITIEVTLTGLGGADIAGLCARYTDINNHWAYYMDTLNNKTRLYKISSGSFVSVIDNVHAPAAGDVLKLGFSSNTWTAYYNGSQVGTGSDAFNNTATKHGLWGYANGTNDRWDSLSITDAAAGGGLPIPVANNLYRQQRAYSKQNGLFIPNQKIKTYCFMPSILKTNLKKAA